MTFDRKEVSFSLDIVWQPLQFAGMFFPGHYLLQKDIVFVRMTNSRISCFNRDLVAQVPPIKKKLAACLNTLAHVRTLKQTLNYEKLRNWGTH